MKMHFHTPLGLFFFYRKWIWQRLCLEMSTLWKRPSDQSMTSQDESPPPAATASSATSRDADYFLTQISRASSCSSASLIGPFNNNELHSCKSHFSHLPTCQSDLQLPCYSECESSVSAGHTFYPTSINGEKFTEQHHVNDKKKWRTNVSGLSKHTVRRSTLAC